MVYIRLWNRGGSFYFRAYIPSRFRSEGERKELRLSLNTRDSEEALPLFRELKRKLENIYMNVDDNLALFDVDQICKVLRTEIALRNRDARRWYRNKKHDEETHDDDHDTLSLLHTELTEDIVLHRKKPRYVEDTKELIEKYNIVLSDDPHLYQEQFEELYSLLLRLHRLSLRVEMALYEGDTVDLEDYDDELKAYFKKHTERPYSKPDEGLVEGGEQPSIDLPLSHMMEAYVKERRGQLRTRTIADHERFMSLLIRCAGDLDTSKVSKAVCVDFKSTLMEMPSNMSKRYPNLSIDEVRELCRSAEVEPMSPRTVNNHLKGLVTIFEWGVKMDTSTRMVFLD